MRAEMDKERAEAKKDHAKMRAEIEKQREQLAPQEAVSAGQLAALQARIETIYQAKLLTEEELFTLEDLCADYAELKSAIGTVTKEMAALHKLVGVSEQIVGDAVFTRQARRKFVAK